jgi:hypothetical protein
MKSALASYCGLYALFSTLLYPSFFLQFSSHFKFEISEYRLWTVLPESSVYLLNNIDEMENSLCQHGIAS